MLDAVMYLHGQIAINDSLVVLGNVWCVPHCFSDHHDDLVEIFKERLDEPFTIIPGLMTAESGRSFTNCQS